MEYALTSCNLDSNLFDIIRFLLQTIFAYKEEEHEFHVGVVSSEKKSLLDTEGTKKEPEEGKENKEGIKEEEETMHTEADNKVSAEGGDKPEFEKKLDDGHLSEEEEDEMVDNKRLDRRLDTIKVAAQAAAKWPLVTQSAYLHELILDPYTCSEVLRLHLLSSGGYAATGEKSWFRHAHRGGYSDADDPAVELQLRRPDLLERLARVAVYDLQPADKLEVLSTLCSQLLSYSVSRDHIEVARARLKKALRELRELCLAEERRKKEKEQKGKKANPKNQKKRKSDRWAAPDTLCVLVLLGRNLLMMWFHLYVLLPCYKSVLHLLTLHFLLHTMDPHYFSLHTMDPHFPLPLLFTNQLCFLVDHCKENVPLGNLQFRNAVQ